MTTKQWIGVILLIVLFFGSLALGRYLRWRDEQEDRRVD